MAPVENEIPVNIVEMEFPKGSGVWTSGGVWAVARCEEAFSCRLEATG